MRMQFKSSLERYYYSEKENTLYKVAAIKKGSEGQATAIIQDMKNNSFIAYGLEINNHNIHRIHKSRYTNEDHQSEKLSKNCKSMKELTLKKKRPRGRKVT